MSELPTIEVCGEVRSIRGWGLSDVFKLQKVLNDFNTGTTLRGFTLDLDSEEFQQNIMGYVAAGLSFSESVFSDWIKSWYDPVIPKDQDIPLDKFVDTLTLLTTHPDILRFLASVSELTSSLGKMAKAKSPKG
jgi:hypothetical protein